MFNKIRNLIAPKEFYKRVLLLAVPVMLQQGITNTVGLLDNLMVSSLGDFALGGVSVVSNIFFVLGALLIGAAAGSGIYIVQFFGAKNYDKMQQVFRARSLFLLIVAALAISVSVFYGESILRLFLDEEQAVIEGMKYLRVMIFTIVPLAVINLYASTYRENQHTMIPMIFGIIAVFINLLFNFLLINGNFGFPRLGVEGAALASLLSRIVEAVLLIVYAHSKKYIFAHKVFRTLYISKDILKNVLIKTLPLAINEFFWSMGMIMLNLSYAQYGLVVVNAFTISSTINNLFFIIFGGLANGIGIIVGQELGANRFENVKLTAARLITFGVVVCWGFGLVLALTSPFTPKLYSDISIESQALATQFMLLVSVFLWVYAYNASCFFTLRAGGSTLSALIFDSLFTWLLPVPVALYVAFFMKGERPNIVLLYFMVQCFDFVKMAIGTYMIRKGKWIRNLTVQS